MELVSRGEGGCDEAGITGRGGGVWMMGMWEVRGEMSYECEKRGR